MYDTPFNADSHIFVSGSYCMSFITHICIFSSMRKKTQPRDKSDSYHAQSTVNMS